MVSVSIKGYVVGAELEPMKPRGTTWLRSHTASMSREHLKCRGRQSAREHILKTEVDDIDRGLINLIQAEFPLVREPFSDLGLKLGISAGQVIHIIERLKTVGIVRQIGPVFDAGSLGYRTTLVAMRVPESRLDNVARVISEHPGVSHCYQRDNRFNLWFTLALPHKVDTESELRKLNGLTGPDDILELPALKVFKIGAYFDMQGKGEALTDTGIDYSRPSHINDPLSPADRALINELQQDLPLLERPFDPSSERLNMDVSEFMERLCSLKQRGLMRRFGASINHTRVGFAANAMACWIVPPEIVDKVGRKLAAFREVSHCYERRTNSLWRYNLFAMIHGRTKGACQGLVSRVSLETNCKDNVLLFSIREFKKVRIRYQV